MSAATPLRFAGYAAVFDRVDRGGDVIRGGAFGDMGAGTGVDMGAGMGADMSGSVPLLWQHRGRPVGAIEAIAPDARGLRVIGRIDDPHVATLVRSGALAGLSIGYRTLAARRGRVRELTRLDLVEVSLVAHPMQPLARVHAVEAPPGAPPAA